MELVALETALREKLSTSSVQNLEGFPCGSYSDFLTQYKFGQLRVGTAYDPGAFEALASGGERVMHHLLTWSPALVGVGLVVTSIGQRNFWLLLGIPLALLGHLFTTPGLMRSFGYPLLLIVSGSAVYTWFQGNRTAAYVLGAYAVSNFLTDVARQQCNMILRKAVGKSEIVLVWLYLKGSVALKSATTAMTKVVAYRNTSTQCFCQIKFGSGERVLISIAGAPKPSIKIFRLVFGGLVPRGAIWELSPTKAGGDEAYVEKFVKLFDPAGRKVEHPLDLLRDILLECKSIDDTRSKLLKREAQLA